MKKIIFFLFILLICIVKTNLHGFYSYTFNSYNVYTGFLFSYEDKYNQEDYNEDEDDGDDEDEDEDYEEEES